MIERREIVTTLIDEAEARIGEIDALFCEEGFFERSGENRVKDLQTEQENLKTRVSELMAEWEDIETQLEEEDSPHDDSG